MPILTAMLHPLGSGVIPVRPTCREALDATTP